MSSMQKPDNPRRVGPRPSTSKPSPLVYLDTLFYPRVPESSKPPTLAQPASAQSPDKPNSVQREPDETTPNTAKVAVPKKRYASELRYKSLELESYEIRML